MRFPLRWSALLLAIVTLLDVILLVVAYDLTTQLKPKGPLGVTLDYSFATSGTPPVPPGKGRQDQRNWVYSSRLKFKQPVATISDGQIVQIALDGYNEIKADMKQYGINIKIIPGAFTVLAFDNELILSSSQKGSKSFTYDFGDSPVLRSLQKCSIVWRDEDTTGQRGDQMHRTEGKCGEEMTAHMYYRSHPGSELQDYHARVVTVGPDLSDKANPRVGIKPPCGPTDKKPLEWGCSLFVQDQNLQEIAADTVPEAYDLNQLPGGAPDFDQIPLCT